MCHWLTVPAMVGIFLLIRTWGQHVSISSCTICCFKRLWTFLATGYAPLLSPDSLQFPHAAVGNRPKKASKALILLKVDRSFTMLQLCCNRPDTQARRR